MQGNSYNRLGQLAAMSLLQGGSGFSVLCPSVYKYLSGVKMGCIDIAMEEVHDYEIMSMIEEVCQVCIIIKFLANCMGLHAMLYDVVKSKIH